jgi:hypothetical protein
VWPRATTSLCLWNVFQAILKHLGDAAGWVIAAHDSHEAIDYGSVDRWGRDASFLDTTWVAEQNAVNEDTVVDSIWCQCPPDMDEHAKRERVLQACRTKQIVCPDKRVRRTIAETMMVHLRFHPLANTCPDQRHAGPIDAWSAWEIQVTKMNELCRSHSESWAWEYLWKEWYCPERWKNWARAVCNIIPIINTNAIVKSLWGTLNRHFLRRTSKTSRSLEYLGEVIMNQYLPTRINKIRAHRQH